MRKFFKILQLSGQWITLRRGAIAPFTGVLLLAVLALFANSASAENLSAKTYGYAGKGVTTCGGLVNGKLQKPCGFGPAIFEADAVGKCPSGTFFDVGKWSCWS